MDWVNGSSDQPRVIGYEEIRRHLEQNQAKALRETLRFSRILHGRDPIEVEEVIVEKVTELERALVKERTVRISRT